MTYMEKWNHLKNDMKLALDEGNERGYYDKSDPVAHGMFEAYKYVMNKMDELDAMD